MICDQIAPGLITTDECGVRKRSHSASPSLEIAFGQSQVLQHHLQKTGADAGIHTRPASQYDLSKAGRKRRALEKKVKALAAA
jgi:hypothetical protein